MEYLQEDYKSIWSHIQHEEKQLRRKRRWLMGFPTTVDSGKKQSQLSKFLNNVFLPESLIREADVSYEIVRSSVLRGFGASRDQRENCIVQDFLHLFDKNEPVSSISKALPAMLDDLNNVGLCRLANIATGGLVMFDKTRLRMKKVIKEYLPKILKNPCHEYHMELLRQLPLLLKNPNNFQENCVVVNSMATSYHSAATKLLEGLVTMPTQTLSAMHRKLRGVQGDSLGIKGDILTLQTPKSGWTRGRLITQVTKICREMLSEVAEGDELQKPLAKAMSVACLSLKLTMEIKHVSMPEFFHFSPGTEALHNEILKALWSLNEMKSKDSLFKELRCLLDPKAAVPIAHFRPAVRRLLIDFLFECSEMDIIPKPLLETLATINRNSQSVATLSFSEVDIEEEVESVLSLSSQIRQIAWDLLADHNMDEEFSNAYMEDLQESDDDQRLDSRSLQSSESCSSEVESVGESEPVDSVFPAFDNNRSGSYLHSVPDKNFASDCIEESQPMVLNDHVRGSTPSCPDSCFPNETQNTSGNQYLIIQENCDDTSVFAHQIIGRLMEAFLEKDGVDLNESKRSYLRGGVSSQEDSPAFRDISISKEDSSGLVLVRVLEGILPSFPKSGIEKVKELMDLK